MIALKKIFMITIALLIIFSCNAFAAQRSTIGFVIVGGAEFKTNDYYKMIKDEFKPKNGAKFIIGDEMQSKYQKYLIEYDMVGNTVPRRQNLVDFVARSGCSEVIFLFVTSSTDHQNNPNTRQKNRISVQVDAYRCDGIRVIDVQTTSQESNSKTSDLRARREAFRKCLDEVAKVYK